MFLWGFYLRSIIFPFLFFFCIVFVHVNFEIFGRGRKLLGGGFILMLRYTGILSLEQRANSPRCSVLFNLIYMTGI